MCGAAITSSLNTLIFGMTRSSSYRGQPVVVVDVRGNSGGNEHWLISWIQRLTGRRAESVFISKSTIMGRVNAFNYWDLPM